MMQDGHVKAGQLVAVETWNESLAGEWTVLDRSPKPGCWWLHRGTGADWETCEARAKDFSLVDDPYRGLGAFVRICQLNPAGPDRWRRSLAKAILRDEDTQLAYVKLDTRQWAVVDQGSGMIVFATEKNQQGREAFAALAAHGVALPEGSAVYADRLELTAEAHTVAAAWGPLLAAVTGRPMNTKAGEAAA